MKFFENPVPPRHGPLLNVSKDSRAVNEWKCLTRCTRRGIQLRRLK